MELEDRVKQCEDDIVGLKTGMAETKVYTKMILDSINKMDVKIDNLGSIEGKKKEPFWDADTKKTVLKWSAIIIIIVIVLLAGRSLAELANILPK